MRTVVLAALRTHLRRYVAAAVAAIGRADLPVSAGDRSFPDTGVGPIAGSEELRWQQLDSGRFPARTGEAVVDARFALAEEIAVGDRLRIGEGAAAADVEVVGIVESPSVLAMASVYVTWPQMLQWREELELRAVAVRGEPGGVPDGAAVQSPEGYIAAVQTELTNRVNTVAVMVLVFAGVALFASVLVIANTFSILLAGRLRDFALLRCVGATRRQVVRSVRREAAAVGVTASLLGTLLGAVLGYGLIALINALAPTAPMGAAEPPALWMAGGAAVGVVVTVVASMVPTRRVLRVSPLAALRPDAPADGRTAAGRVRPVLAALLLAAGTALLGAAMVQDGVVLMVVGGGAVFTGVLLAGPVLVPRLVRITGALLGPAGRLATANAVRNPRRTAATTASLLVGVTLATAVLTGTATTRAAVGEELDGLRPIDAALTSPERPVTAELLDRVRSTPGVDRAIAVDGVVARVAGLDDPIPVLAAPTAERVARDGGAFARVGPGEIRLGSESFGRDLDLRAGDRVTVRVGRRDVRLEVAAGYSTGWGRAGVVAPETLAALTGAPRPHAVWIQASSGADTTQLGVDLDAVADPVGAEVESTPHGSVERQLALITWSVLGLLGVAVVIALIGIGNTLGLSVLERAREHALLRALGLTRGRLRRMLAAESALLSAVAGVLGTALGVGFAWVGHETVVTAVLSEATMEPPWLQLGCVVLGAALAGLLAAVLPGRRAARVTPAAGLARD